MGQSDGALFIVLLSGALCSSAFAYYFPNGPSHRPSRQAVSSDSNTTFKPEPRQLQTNPLKTIPIPIPNYDGKNLSDTVPLKNPSNQTAPTESIVTVKPEPRRYLNQGFPESFVSGASLDERRTVNVVTMDRETTKRHSKSIPEPLKSEPRGFSGIKIIMRNRKTTSDKRQSKLCSQNYAFARPGQSAVLQSSNYPRSYPNNVQSSTCFTSPAGTKMSIVCDDFNVEYSRSCTYDYFGIALSGNPRTIQKYCGRGTLRSSPTSGNSLAIVFKSDYSNPGSSSRNPYRFSCIVTVSGSSGSTNPPTTLAPPPPVDIGNCTCGRRNDGSRIVGGSNAKLNEFPWRCYLKTSRHSFFCGCTIISNRWILTAAHCPAAVLPLPSDDALYVVVGDHDRSSSTEAVSQQIAVEQVYDHSAYDDQTMDNDISLLKLSRALIFTNTISPICLPFKYTDDEFESSTVTASGWGTTSQGGSVSNILQKVDLPLLTTAQCSEYYPGQITERMICTYLPGKDSCQGDSGGSIDLKRDGRYYHIGVVSWGIGCAQQSRPGVYAKTTKFLNWITETTGEGFCRT